MDALQPNYWLYLGFSAEDIQTDPEYLGLVAGAARSAGATYVAYPGNPILGKGARILMNAYGDRREVWGASPFWGPVSTRRQGRCELCGMTRTRGRASRRLWRLQRRAAFLPGARR